MGALGWFSATFLPASPRMGNWISQNGRGHGLQSNYNLTFYLLVFTRFLRTNFCPLGSNRHRFSETSGESK